MSKQAQLVVGYVRCSSMAQVDDGTTIDRQKSLIESYCTLKNLGAARFIVDEAVSGAKENRAGLAELLTLVKVGKVSTVIVADLSRLSRSVKHTLEMIELFTKRQVTFVSLNEDIRTDTAMGKFFLTLCSAFNQMYRDSIADRMKMTWQHKRSRNEKCGGHTPFGYDVAGKTLVENVQEQAIIRSIVELKNAGKTYLEIKKALMDHGVPTKTGKARWNVNTICNIVRRHKQRRQLPQAS